MSADRAREKGQIMSHCTNAGCDDTRRCQPCEYSLATPRNCEEDFCLAEGQIVEIVVEHDHGSSGNTWWACSEHKAAIRVRGRAALEKRVKALTGRRRA